MTAVTISNARENLIGLVRHVCEDHAAIEIVGAAGNAVLMSAEDYQSMRGALAGRAGTGYEGEQR